MFYNKWEPIYQKIAKEFNFPQEKEEQSAEVLENILKKRRLYPIKKLKGLIENKEVFVFGAGPSLETSLVTYEKEFFGKVKIAVDGATSALLEENIWPDIIVTDLDGKVSDQILANSNGSIAILHAHGDNIPKIKKYVPEFNGAIIGTIQINPEPYENIHNFGGFTDGDRAVFLASHFHAKKISLIGFDFGNKVGKYSFSENKDKKLKMKKLERCKQLIELLNKKYQNIQ